MQTIASFIRANTEQILSEWESFARTLPVAATMDIVALRDHAKQMLEVIALDLETPQSNREQSEKARGESDAQDGGALTAAQEHGAGRAESGFSIQAMVSEFRALRASVVRLWTRSQTSTKVAILEDLTRFNEAIDQAIAESIGRYTGDITESKERFLAILGHDLRTPLGAIITSSQFMLDAGELREPNLTLVTRIAGSARRMNQMVVDLLDFTRTRFGDSIPIVRTDADLRKLLHDVVTEVAASEPGSTVQVETSGELRGQWDSNRLTQALTNLVANAVHHGSEGAPIKVSARGTPTEIVMAVQNEGPLIPREQLNRIFEPMSQLNRDAARNSNHLGLGLYIVERIVSAHGGAIDVHSSSERGTIFTIHLPRFA